LGESLNLSLPAIAIAFSNTPVEGIPTFEGHVAAGCSFWQLAATKTFCTSAVDHSHCSIGVHTHNLAGVPASQPGELQASLEVMMGLDYVREEEVARIPVLEQETSHVVYGPLSEFPMEPELVLLFAHAQQGLILSEAVARVDGGTPAAMGRPACAVVPQAMNTGQAVMSLGCCGARAYLDAMTDSVALWALPGSTLEEYTKEIEVLANANGILSQFHTQRRKDGDSGERPTVQQSVEKLAP
jgi:uncharacterized protein (DUF169 family)